MGVALAKIVDWDWSFPLKLSQYPLQMAHPSDDIYTIPTWNLRNIFGHQTRCSWTSVGFETDKNTCSGLPEIAITSSPPSGNISYLIHLDNGLWWAMRSHTVPNPLRYAFGPFESPQGNVELIAFSNALHASKFCFYFLSSRWCFKVLSSLQMPHFLGGEVEMGGDFDDLQLELHLQTCGWRKRQNILVCLSTKES